MRKRLFTLGMVGLIIFGIAGCSKNKSRLTRSQPTDIPYYNPANEICFAYPCHGDSALKRVITTDLGTEIVPLYVNREKFARSLHRANQCLDCHTDIVKGHTQVPKTYGGWVNFSAEDTIQTLNYTTKASISCVNCHTGQTGFLSSQHYLIEDIKNSHMDPNSPGSGIVVGKNYDKAKCGKCHVTCATCHFKAVKLVAGPGGEITDYWSDLLKGELISTVEPLTNWAIDWTTNIESHNFSTGEELENSDFLCRICHTGFYTNYNKTGYYHPDGLSDFDSLISQGVEKYAQYEERRLIKGDIVVHTGIPSIDSAYERIANEGVMKEYSCTYCHDRIHSLTPVTCLKCHNDKLIPTEEEHSDVACIACHDATMNVWRDPDADDTVRVAAVKNNKVINWHSHMLVKPDGETTDFCERKCHNPETGRIIGAPFDEPHQGTIHEDD